MMMAKYGAVVLIAILFIFFLRFLAKTIADALNPPLPNWSRWASSKKCR